MPRLKHLLPAILILALPTLWCAGLAAFTLDALRSPPPPPHCDGIAVLTGGQNRIETAFTLMHQGYARQLLISGVGPHATIAQLSPSPNTTIPPDRIALGRHAVTTLGNAMEVADWTRRHNLHTVLIVTAGYHLRRAILDMQRAAPNVQFSGYPVRPPALLRPTSPTTIHLLIREYDKLIGAWLGLSRGNALI